jgi:hypothetical protein
MTDPGTTTTHAGSQWYKKYEHFIVAEIWRMVGLCLIWMFAGAFLFIYLFIYIYIFRKMAKFRDQNKMATTVIGCFCAVDCIVVSL